MVLPVPLLHLRKNKTKTTKFENSFPQINTLKFAQVIEEYIILKILGDNFDESNTSIQFLVLSYDLIKLTWQRHKLNFSKKSKFVIKRPKIKTPTKHIYASYK